MSCVGVLRVVCVCLCVLWLGARARVGARCDDGDGDQVVLVMDRSRVKRTGQPSGQAGLIGDMRGGFGGAGSEGLGWAAIPDG